jgi:hypothetical protein
MGKFLIFFVISASSQITLAQDERFYRQLFDGSLNRDYDKDLVYKYEIKSPEYMLDLNRDGVVDVFQTTKKDGVDFFKIYDANGNLKFETKLAAKGKHSRIFKAHLVDVAPNADALILHYYEGDTQDAVFEGSARLYIVTIRDRDLKKISITKGPYFWHEREVSTPHYHKYWNRRFIVNTLDYNKDGIKEISVSFNRMHQIMYYTGFGVWKLMR